MWINIIVSMRNKGYTLQYIADTLNIRRGTVSDVIVRFKKRGSTDNKPRSGRPRILDPRDERSLVRLIRTNRKVPLGDLSTQTQTSVSTNSTAMFIQTRISQTCCKEESESKGSKQKQETKLVKG